LLLCALSVTAFFAGFPGLILTSAVVITASLIGKIPIPSLFSGSKALAVTTLVVVALRAVTTKSDPSFSIRIDEKGCVEGLLFAWGVFASFALGSVLFATTTTAELRFALSRLEKKTKHGLRAILPVGITKKIDSFDLSLTIALALAFIPRVFSIWEAAEYAYRARSGKMGILGTAKLIPLVAERLIEAAAETAHAMVSRGYENGTPVSLD